MQRNSHQREACVESIISVEEAEENRLLRLLVEALKRRNIFCQDVHTQTEQEWAVRTTSTQKALQQELKTTNISGCCGNNVSTTQFAYNTNQVSINVIRTGPANSDHSTREGRHHSVVQRRHHTYRSTGIAYYLDK
ncbi:hypothetical protein KIN20_029503 [Parelaphostrongylus tenuis]|uniref:Uncharacterized protein n=1 Tax=Parelaphostrongylus tenuis TaxID=148309 RepID=A0AAD5WG52_PARTN|nr:hypothetical protein KIN20_029503 [Parelaphostrongylus tenuis]